MAYNKETDASAGYISHWHKELLDRLCAAHRRTKRAELEWLIEQAVHDAGLFTEAERAALIVHRPNATWNLAKP